MPIEVNRAGRSNEKRACGSYEVPRRPSVPGSVLKVLVAFLAAMLLGGGTKPKSEGGALAAPSVFEPGIAVYISGAVRRPGVYRMAPGSRVADAIGKAGGATRGAGVADLDLAAPVQDGESVRVPAPGERAAASQGSQPIVRLPGSFDPRAGERRRATRPRRRPGAVSAPRPIMGAARRSVVALNRASASDLQRLPGVGPGLASRIIAYRRRAGRFGRIEELREVPGIGEKRLARIAPHVDLR